MKDLPVILSECDFSVLDVAIDKYFRDHKIEVTYIGNALLSLMSGGLAPPITEGKPPGSLTCLAFGYNHISQLK